MLPSCPYAVGFQLLFGDSVYHMSSYSGHATKWLPEKRWKPKGAVGIAGTVGVHRWKTCYQMDTKGTFWSEICRFRGVFSVFSSRFLRCKGRYTPLVP